MLQGSILRASDVDNDELDDKVPPETADNIFSKKSEVSEGA